MKTRSRKSQPVRRTESVGNETPTIKALDANVETPPHIFILPKGTSSDARLVSLPNPVTGSLSRYFVCPKLGFHELKEITALKQTPRSWLLAPNWRRVANSSNLDTRKDLERGNIAEQLNERNESPGNAGYVLRKPSLFVATPIDPLFIVLPALAGPADTVGQEFLAPSDYVTTITDGSPHLQYIIQSQPSQGLGQILEKRLEAVCDCMDIGNDKMYALSIPRLVKELVHKTRRTASKGLPASLEERFVKQALEIPHFNTTCEESNISSSAMDSNTETENGIVSQIDQQNNKACATASSKSVLSSENSQPGLDEIADLLRLRVAFNFIIASYIPLRLQSKLEASFRDQTSSGIDFTPLDKHLSQIDALKRKAQALRSLSDNISRKRCASEDEEAVEKLEAKRIRKEEEENKKRKMSQGVKQLMKADTSGMKKLSVFFAKTPTKI